ncbi:MAG: hypothetical protein CVV23_10910 [Ignavibacteriae bacterium HGW-Ignavibacteriae-2]|jgi:hypothetical protein|nr:MAG: hypothetical protein CVV23_10910 [Ignavibacteriae bacterium HGW-Ignavibacteriae-2]
MKVIHLFVIILAFALINCKNEDSSPEKQTPIAEKNIPLSEEYNWRNYDDKIAFGEVLFVPVYSSIYHQSERTFDLAATLSIHNTDLHSQLIIIKIDYYDSDGNLVENFIKEKVELNPLGSKQFIIKETDISGGTAAKFIIQWVSEKQIIKPIVEAVMISTSSQQGISFKTESRILSSIGY